MLRRVAARAGLLDRDDEGNDFEGWAKRGAALAKGLFYAGFSLLAFSLVAGPRGESRDEPQQTSRVFDLPLGRWLVLALGLGLIGYGLAKRLPLDHREVPQAPEDGTDRGRTWGRS